ncbi:MAG: hypothetical protein IPI55_05790 [Flavobacteriales bacterium]|nr:hypothetical protein [Flavobacteriales bacterium]
MAQRTIRPQPQRLWADSVLHVLNQNLEREPHATLEMTARMMFAYRQDRDSCRMAGVQAFRCLSFDQLGQLDSAMLAMQSAFKWFQPGCDSLVLMRAYLGMSSVYLSLGENHLVDSVCAAAIRLWNPQWKFTAVRNGLHTNRAIARVQLDDLEGALASFRSVLRLAREENNPADIDGALTNIGVLKGMQGDLDSSDHYYGVALEAARSKRDISPMVKQFMNLGDNQLARGRNREAIALYDSALVLSRSSGDLQEQMRIEDQMSRSYADLGDHAMANEHLRAHLQLKDSLLNTEKVRVLTDMQEKYESEKKAKEIKELQVQKLDADLRTEKARRTRNIYLFAAIGVLGLAGGLWNMLRYTRRSRTAIQKEKDVSEGLLLNILPEEVAAELKVKGYADAKEFDTATILFSDFKGFTELSEKLTAAQLIDELNICFKAFDGIMHQYHVEKIKTIGDAYMAAGGLPDTAKGAPADVLMAALDMQTFMATYGAEREQQGRPHFTMRVGLHTGAVIAGIVGVKKFAYDIWGDTVNTASRMESSGEVGRVNISNATYLLVKDDTRFAFTSRGMVSAKGKGEMEMWFAERKA